jgi:hypothetical protein
VSNANTIAILPHDQDDRRVRVTLQNAASGGGLRLTEETFSDGVGWFAQAHVDLSPAQVSELRQALGLTLSSGATRKIARPQAAAFAIHRAG